MRPLLALLLLVLPPLARAHDRWIEPAGDGYVLRSGHRGREARPIDAATVKALRCLAGAGAPRDVRAAATFAPVEVRIAARCAVVSAASDLGFSVLTPDGEKHLPRTQAPDAVKSWRSRQYAKWVDARSPAAATAVGDELELVPATPLGRLKVGDTYTLRVLLDGKPAPGAVLDIADRVLGETDREGLFRMRVEGPGVQSVTASLRRPLGTPEADTLVLEANLTFEVRR
jgi:nickel transport protein